MVFKLSSNKFILDFLSKVWFTRSPQKCFAISHVAKLFLMCDLWLAQRVLVLISLLPTYYDLLHTISLIMYIIYINYKCILYSLEINS